MPVTNRAVDVYGKMRADYGPRAMSTVNRTVRDTWSASEPYRNEAIARGSVAVAGLRGHVRPEDVATIVDGRGHGRRRRVMLLAGAVCTGAAAAAGFAAWRMSRGPAWVDDTGAADEADADGDADEVDGITHKVKDAAHRMTDRVKIMAHQTADAASPDGSSGDT